MSHLYSKRNNRLVKSQGACPDGWRWIAKKCFRFFPESINWIESESKCVGLGGHLASIHSHTENKAVASLLGTEDYAFIGLYDSGTDNTWLKWSDGTSRTYTNWNSPGAPGNTINEDYAFIYGPTVNTAYKWGDCPSDRSYPYICQVLPYCDPLYSSFYDNCLSQEIQSYASYAVGQQLDFSGNTQDLIDLSGNYPVVQGNAARSISVKFRMNSQSADLCAILINYGFGTGYGRSFDVCIGTTISPGNLGIHINCALVFTEYKFTNGIWYDLTVSYDSQSVLFFVDQIFVASLDLITNPYCGKTTSDTISPIDTEGSAITIGGSSGSNALNFVGSLKNIYFYNEAICGVDQIIDHVTGYCISCPIGTSSLFFERACHDISYNNIAQYASRAGSTDSDAGYSITTLDDGSAIVTGSFKSTAYFGSTISVVSIGDSDVFVAKIKADGTWDWVVSIGGSGEDKGKGITSLADGSSIVTGYFQGTASFTGVSGTSISLTSTGSADIFVAKISNAGQFIWVCSGGGGAADISDGITTYADGSSRITGYFHLTASFSPTVSGSPISISPNEIGADIFVAKITSDGLWEWVRKGGSAPSGETGNGITAHFDGSCTVTGKF